ncbi:MAG: hypothetical protein HC806_09930 [Anaerolineae bacterium]|nr:hypothetical protein [Anaerolineae bacterium]
MIQTFIQLSVLASLLFEEEHPPAGVANPFDFGLSPFWVVVIVLLVFLFVWLALRSQAGRDDLHTAGHHDDVHGHEEPDHSTEMEVVHHTEEPVVDAVMAMEEPAPEPEAASEPVSVPATPPAPAKPDDLRKIEGIGPKVASVLNDAGISTFAELAAAEVTRIQATLDAAGYQYMNPVSWPDQAKLAAVGDWDGLEKLQDNLKGGR